MTEVDLFGEAPSLDVGGDAEQARPGSSKRLARATPRGAASVAAVTLATRDLINAGEMSFEQRPIDSGAASAQDDVTNDVATSNDQQIEQPMSMVSASSEANASNDRPIVGEEPSREPLPSILTGQVPQAEVGETFFVAFGALSIAADNPWGDDATDDEPFRRVLASVSMPSELEPMLVVRAGNGWKIVGDPAALIAISRVNNQPESRAAVDLPVREITGSKAAIVLHTARQALGGRVFKNMRRARLSLRLCETEGLNGKDVAAHLGLHGSGTTRDLKAARMEREHPMLAQILTSPSDAPVSYYTALRDYAETQAAPDKAMSALVSAATRLTKVGKTFTATEAKVALGITKPATRSDWAPTSVALKASGHLKGAVLERTTSGTTRLVLSFPPDAMPEAERIAVLEQWLATAAPLFGNAS